jgi:hypothetical protein
MQQHVTEDARVLFRARATAPLFARPLSGSMPDECYSRLSEPGFDEFLKRSLVKKIDISIAGLSFESDIPYATGDVIELRLMLEDVYRGVIDLCVKVLRVDVRPRHYRIAVTYIELDENVKKLISDFVFSRAHRM